MMIMFAVIIVLLVILEYVTRNSKNKLDTKDTIITREKLEENLDQIDHLNYTYGKFFACHLENLNLILIPKTEYPKSDQLVVMHEIGHFLHFTKIKETLKYKILLYSKGSFYILGVLTMFSLLISIIFKPFIYVLKYLLIILIGVQFVHLILLSYSEYVANTYLSGYFQQGRDAMVYAYVSMLSQIIYWFLFVMLTIVFYQLIFL